MSALATALVWPAGLAATAGPRPADEAEADRELVRASQRGEREAFDRLVTRYQRNIYRLCYRYVNQHEDASDLAQEVFVRAWRAIGSFRGDSAVSTWLYRIAVNACLNHRAVRRPALAEVPEGLPDPRPGALSGIVSEEQARRVREAVSRLPEKQRATLILKVYQELSHDEAAAVLGCSVGTVKSNLFHALANLRRLLGPEEARP